MGMVYTVPSTTTIDPPRSVHILGVLDGRLKAYQRKEIRNFKEIGRHLWERECNTPSVVRPIRGCMDSSLLAYSDIFTLVGK